jgi:hypothetical protein
MNRPGQSEYNKAYYLGHREEIKAQVKRYRVANLKVVRERERLYAAAHRADRKEYDKIYHKEHWREYHLRRKYGITVPEYDELMRRQGSVCACCGSANGGVRAFHLDHDHRTGKVRGILCNNCNAALGLIRDDPEIALAMANYLKKHKKQEGT